MTSKTLHKVKSAMECLKELLQAFKGDSVAFQEEARRLGLHANEASVLWNLKEGEKEQ